MARQARQRLRAVQAQQNTSFHLASPRSDTAEREFVWNEASRVQREAQSSLTTARPTAAAAVPSPNVSMETHEVGWLPLVGSHPSAIRLQHPEPLAALRDGQVPAIVVRQALLASEAAAIVARLHPRWEGPRRGNMKSWGPQLSKSLIDLSKGPATRDHSLYVRSSFFNNSARFDAASQAAGVHRAVRVLHDTLAALHHSATATLQALSPGVFRRQSTGNRCTDSTWRSCGPHISTHRLFPTAIPQRPSSTPRRFLPHTDTLHAVAWTQRCRQVSKLTLQWEQHSHGACLLRSAARAEGRLRTSSACTRPATAFADMHRFEHQFSALLMLQMPRGQAEVMLYDTHLLELLSACNISGQLVLPFALP